MSNDIAIHRTFPVGSRWKIPIDIHPNYGDETLDGRPAVDPTTTHFIGRVANHTVGAGLQRRQDAGIMFQAEDTRTFFEVKDGLALDAMQRLK